MCVTGLTLLGHNCRNIQRKLGGNELNESREECKKCGSHKLIIGVKE